MLNMVNWTKRQGEAPKELAWLDGHIYVLKPGVDFSNLGSLRAKLWKVGDRYGHRVRTKLENGVLYVQGLDLEGNERPDAEFRHADGSLAPSRAQ